MTLYIYRKETKTRNKRQKSPHPYEEVNKKFSKAIDDEDEIVFDITILHAHPNNESLFDITGTYEQPQNEGTVNNVTGISAQSSAAYRVDATKPADNDWKFQCNYEVMHAVSK